MLVDNASCLAHWLSFATQVDVVEGNGLGRRQIVHGRYHPLCTRIVQEITVYEPAKRLEWTNTEEHPAVQHVPRLDRSTTITVELIPEGAGTRVRIESAQDPAGPLRGLAMRLLTQRAIERHIRQSLVQLESMLKGQGAV